ncbi:MAG: response regulator [Desulfuromonadales bacterium]|nr:response regulator [Desulfuromonadales bacterium]
MPGTVSLLYVEDETATREVVTDMLKLNGCNCIVAENGLQGLELYRRHTPDIVLSDIMMPVMSGMEMARAIRADFPEAQFIFMTALGESKFILEAIDIGVTQYVVKPVELPKLLAAIAHCEAIIRLKAEARRVKNLESIAVLAGGLAHDYNNLLQMFMGCVSLAKMSVEPGSEAYSHLTMAESVSNDVRELSRRLMIFSGGGSGLMQKTAPTPLIMSGVRAALGGAAVTPVFDLPTDIPQILLDMTLMQQVISHLTFNAIEAMPKGGMLQVAACVSSLSQESGLPLPPGDYVHLTFSDTGSGIPPENLAKIFDPYFTTKKMGVNKGQGLGLSVCHSIIRKHGGLISANNSSGAGATFNIWLPVADETL